MNSRVVVTGLGAISPLGADLAQTWEGMKQGKSGIGPITRFDATHNATKIAGEVPDFDPTRYMDRKDAKRTARFAQFAIAASKQAWEHAGLDIEKLQPERVGVFIGSGMGALDVLEEQILTLGAKGPDRVSPFLIPMTIVNMAAGNVAIHLGAKGPNLCQVSACATGGHAIGDAFHRLQRGEVDVMIAGGAEATICSTAIAGFNSAKALSSNNEAGSQASRPFDANRDGFVMGEGSGILILETLEHAQKRGARILAEVVGYGMTGDAYHITSPGPEGEGLVRAMEMAARDAGVGPEAIGYVNAHGTSTNLNDKTETQAYKAYFGDRAKQLPISSTKSMTGHLLGAAGGIEAIATVMALNEGILPPTINLQTPDPDCDLDYIPNQARKAQADYAMSNNLGFGGQNVSLIFKRWNG
ncbi:3-oxoacyl-[acyl-carrier-protein] synthase 2 [compost metagenome]